MTCIWFMWTMPRGRLVMVGADSGTFVWKGTSGIACAQSGELGSERLGGRLVVPHAEGAEPMVRMSVPPSAIWLWRNQDRSSGAPFRVADWTNRLTCSGSRFFAT